MVILEKLLFDVGVASSTDYTNIGKCLFQLGDGKNDFTCKY